MRTIFLNVLLAVAAAGSSGSQNTKGTFHGDQTSAGAVEQKVRSHRQRATNLKVRKILPDSP